MFNINLEFKAPPGASKKAADAFFTIEFDVSPELKGEQTKYIENGSRMIRWSLQKKLILNIEISNSDLELNIALSDLLLDKQDDPSIREICPELLWEAIQQKTQNMNQPKYHSGLDPLISKMTYELGLIHEINKVSLVSFLKLNEKLYQRGASGYAIRNFSEELARKSYRYNQRGFPQSIEHKRLSDKMGDYIFAEQSSKSYIQSSIGKSTMGRNDNTSVFESSMYDGTNLHSSRPSFDCNFDFAAKFMPIGTPAKLPSTGNQASNTLAAKLIKAAASKPKNLENSPLHLHQEMIESSYSHFSQSVSNASNSPPTNTEPLLTPANKKIQFDESVIDQAVTPQASIPVPAPAKDFSKKMTPVMTKKMNFSSTSSDEDLSKLSTPNKTVSLRLTKDNDLNKESADPKKLNRSIEADGGDSAKSNTNPKSEPTIINAVTKDKPSHDLRDYSATGAVFNQTQKPIIQDEPRFVPIIFSSSSSSDESKKQNSAKKSPSKAFELNVSKDSESQTKTGFKDAQKDVKKPADKKVPDRRGKLTFASDESREEEDENKSQSDSQNKSVSTNLEKNSSSKNKQSDLVQNSYSKNPQPNETPKNPTSPPFKAIRINADLLKDTVTTAIKPEAVPKKFSKQSKETTKRQPKFSSSNSEGESSNKQSTAIKTCHKATNDDQPGGKISQDEPVQNNPQPRDLNLTEKAYQPRNIPVATNNTIQPGQPTPIADYKKHGLVIETSFDSQTSYDNVDHDTAAQLPQAAAVIQTKAKPSQTQTDKLNDNIFGDAKFIELDNPFTNPNIYSNPKKKEKKVVEDTNFLDERSMDKGAIMYNNQLMQNPREGIKIQPKNSSNDDPQRTKNPGQDNYENSLADNNRNQNPNRAHTGLPNPPYMDIRQDEFEYEPEAHKDQLFPSYLEHHSKTFENQQPLDPLVVPKNTVKPAERITQDNSKPLVAAVVILGPTVFDSFESQEDPVFNLRSPNEEPYHASASDKFSRPNESVINIKKKTQPNKASDLKNALDSPRAPTLPQASSTGITVKPGEIDDRYKVVIDDDSSRSPLKDESVQVGADLADQLAKIASKLLCQDQEQCFESGNKLLKLAMSCKIDFCTFLEKVCQYNESCSAYKRNYDFKNNNIPIAIENLMNYFGGCIEIMNSHPNIRESLQVLYQMENLFVNYDSYSKLAKRLIASDNMYSIFNAKPGVISEIKFTKDSLGKICEFALINDGPKSLARFFCIHALCNQCKDKNLKDALTKNKSAKLGHTTGQILDSARNFKAYFGTDSSFKIFLQATIAANGLDQVLGGRGDNIDSVIKDMISLYKKEEQVPVIQALFASPQKQLDKIKNEYIPNLIGMLTNEVAVDKFSNFFSTTTLKTEDLKKKLDPIFSDTNESIKKCLMSGNGGSILLKLVDIFKSGKNKETARDIAQAYILPMCDKILALDLYIDLARQLMENPNLSDVLSSHMVAVGLQSAKVGPAIKKIQDALVELDKSNEFLKNLSGTTHISDQDKYEYQTFNQTPTIANLQKVVDFRSMYPGIDRLVSTNINIDNLNIQINNQNISNDDASYLKATNKLIEKELEEFNKKLKSCARSVTQADYELVYKTIKNSKEDFKRFASLADPSSSPSEVSQAFSNLALYNVASKVVSEGLVDRIQKLEAEYSESFGLELVGYAKHLDKLSLVNGILGEKSIKETFPPLKDLATLLFQYPAIFDGLQNTYPLFNYFKGKVDRHYESIEYLIIEMKAGGDSNAGLYMAEAEAQELLSCLQTLKSLVIYMKTLSPKSKEGLAPLVEGLVDNYLKIESHGSKPSSTLNRDQNAITGRKIAADLLTLAGRAERLIKVSKVAGDRNSEDFHIASSITLDSHVELYFDKSEDHYKTKFTIGTSRKLVSISDLRQLFASFVQLSDASNGSNKYKSKAEDLKFIIDKMGSIKNILEDLYIMGAVLSFEKVITAANVKSTDTTVEIIISKDNKDEQEPRTDRSNIEQLEKDLIELNTGVKQSINTLSGDPNNNWILRIHGKQKITLAKAVLEGKIGLNAEVKNIFKYLFGNDFDDEKRVNKHHNVAEPQKFQNTNQILKGLLNEQSTSVRIDKANRRRKIRYGGYDTDKYWSLFAYISQFKIVDFAPTQFLLLNDYTKEQDIAGFLEGAFSDPSRHYIIMDLHLLQPKLRDFLVKIVRDRLTNKDIESEINTNIMIFVAYESIAQVYSEFDKYRDYIEQVSLSTLNDKGNVVVRDCILENLNKLKLTIVDSKTAGLGKSHYISQEAKSHKAKVATLVLSGEINEAGINKRLELIKDKLTSKCVLSIKLDMMENMAANIDLVDQQIFKICMLRCMKYEDSFIFFDSVSHFYIEISSNYKDSLLANMQLLRFIQKLYDDYDKDESHFIRKMRYSVPDINFTFNFDIDIELMVNTICNIYELTANKAYQKNNLYSIREWDLEQRMIKNAYKYKDPSECLNGLKQDLQNDLVKEKSRVPKNNEDETQQRFQVSDIKEYMTDLDKYIKKRKVTPLDTRNNILKAIISLKEPDNKNAKSRVLESCTMSQVVTLIKVLYKQFHDLEFTSGLNPEMTNYDDPNPRSDIHKLGIFLKESRISLVNKIVELTNHFAWGNVQSLRDMAIKAKDLRASSNLTAKEIAAKNTLDRAENMTKISKWNEEARFNVFFINDVIKVVYQDVNQVPEEMAKIISFSMHPVIPIVNLLKQFKAMNPEDQQVALINEMCVAFSTKSSDLKQSLGIGNTVTVKEWANKLLEGNNQKKKKLFDRIKASFGDPSLNTNGKWSFDNALPFLMQLKAITFSSGKGYEMNLDNSLKMLLIFQRVNSNLPAVIVGATGCGKTYLVRFLVEVILNETFIEFCLHSGISERDLEDMIEFAAMKASETPTKKVWVFFDEFNTSPLQSLIDEIMTSRTANFSRKLEKLCDGSGKLPENIGFVAACNPCKIKVSTSTVGLIHENTQIVFSHRVYPIPETLLNFAFDFGQLTDEVKNDYIKGMLASINNEASKQRLVTCITIAQKMIIELENESSVSLRDVTRVYQLYKWLSIFLLELSPDNPDLLDDLVIATTIYLCYIIRAGMSDKRQKLDKLLTQSVKFKTEYSNLVKGESFTAGFEYVSGQLIKDLSDVKFIKDDVRSNKALRENIFSIVVAVATKIPIMIIGKPGTSKTLSISLMRDFLNDIQVKKKSRFFNEFPEVQFKEFCGSQLTTSGDILKHVEYCKKDVDEFTRQKINKTVIFVFDEMGLAEIGYDNALKVLHPILEPKDEPQFGFIGISNWLLDLSKMSRAVFVPRPDPEIRDLEEIINVPEIEAMTNKAHKETFEAILKQIPQTYLDFVKNEGAELRMSKEITERAIQNDNNISKNAYRHPNFFGLRDMYHFSKYIQRHAEHFSKTLATITQTKNLRESQVQRAILRFVTMGIFRNFSGKESSDKIPFDYSNLKGSAKLFRELLLKNLQNASMQKDEYDFRPIDLINQCLVDKGSRHLMIFVDKSSLIDMINIQLKAFFKGLGYPESSIKTLYKSDRKDADNIIQNLEGWIESGFVLIMKDMEDIYSSLYDVLNQKYFKNDDENSEFAYLQFGSARKPKAVKVNPKFRAVILMNRVDSIESMQERNHPPPFLNRFEKQLLIRQDLITGDQTKIDKKVREDIAIDFGKTEWFQENLMIHNYSQDLVQGLLLEITQNDSQIKQNDMNSYLTSIIDHVNTDTNTIVQNGDNIFNKRVIDIKEVRLVKFYSRNMLIQLYDKDRLRYTAALKKIFKDTHPYESINDLYKKLSKDLNHRKGLIYTFSGQIELEESLEIEQLKNISHSMDFELILRVNLSDRLATIQSKVERYKLFVINIIGIKNWANAEIARSYLDQVNIPSEHCVVVIMQYSYEDLVQQSTIDNWVGYSGAGWKIAVIDDLRNSCYKWFVDSLDQNYCKVLQENDLLKQIIQKELELKLGVKNVPQDLVDSIFECIKNRAETNPNFKNVTLFNKLKEKKSEFKKHFDALLVIQEIIKIDFETEVKEVLKKIGKAACYSIIHLSNLFSKSFAKRISADWIHWAKEEARHTNSKGTISDEQLNPFNQTNFDERHKSLVYNPGDLTSAVNLKQVINKLLLSLSRANNGAELARTVQTNRIAYTKLILEQLVNWETEGFVKIDSKEVNKWEKILPPMCTAESMAFFSKFCEQNHKVFSLLERQIVARVCENVLIDINDVGFSKPTWKQILMLPILVQTMFDDKILILYKTCKIENREIDNPIIEQHLKGEGTGIPLGPVSYEQDFKQFVQKISKLMNAEDLKRLGEQTKAKLGVIAAVEIEKKSEVAESLAYKTWDKIISEMVKQDARIQTKLQTILKEAANSLREDQVNSIALIQEFTKLIIKSSKDDKSVSNLAKNLMKSLLKIIIEHDTEIDLKMNIVTMYMEIVISTEEEIASADLGSLAEFLVKEFNVNETKMETEPSEIFKTFCKYICNKPKNTKNVINLMPRILQLLVDKIDTKSCDDMTGNIFNKNYERIKSIKCETLNTGTIWSLGIIIKYIELACETIMSCDVKKNQAGNNINILITNQLKSSVQKREPMAAILVSRLCVCARGNYHKLLDNDLDILSKEAINFVYRIKLHNVNSARAAEKVKMSRKPAENVYYEIIAAINLIILEGANASQELAKTSLEANRRLLETILKQETVTGDSSMHMKLIFAHAAAISAVFKDSSNLNFAKMGDIQYDRKTPNNPAAEGLVRIVNTIIAEFKRLSESKIDIEINFSTCDALFKAVGEQYFDREDYLAHSIHLLLEQISQISQIKGTHNVSSFIIEYAISLSSLDTKFYSTAFRESISRTQFEDYKKASIEFELISMGLIIEDLGQVDMMKIIGSSFKYNQQDARKCQTELRKTLKDDFSQKSQQANFLAVVSQKVLIICSIQTLILALAKFLNALNVNLQINGYRSAHCGKKKLSDLLEMSQEAAKDKGIKVDPFTLAYQELCGCWSEYQNLIDVYREYGKFQGFVGTQGEVEDHDQMKSMINDVVNPNTVLATFIVDESIDSKKDDRFKVMPSIIRNLVGEYNSILQSIAPIVFDGNNLNSKEAVEAHVSKKCINFLDVTEANLLNLRFKGDLVKSDSADEGKASEKSVERLLQKSLKRKEDDNTIIELNGAVEEYIDEILGVNRQRVCYIKLLPSPNLVLSKLKDFQLVAGQQISDLFKLIRDNNDSLDLEKISVNKNFEEDKDQQFNMASVMTSFKNQLSQRPLEDIQNLDAFIVAVIENPNPSVNKNKETSMKEVMTHLDLKQDTFEYRVLEKVLYGQLPLLMVAIRSTLYDHYASSTANKEDKIKAEKYHQVIVDGLEESLKNYVEKTKSASVPSWIRRLSLEVDFLKTLYIMAVWQNRMISTKPEYLKRLQIKEICSIKNTFCKTLFNKNTLKEIEELRTADLERAISSGTKFLETNKQNKAAPQATMQMQDK